MIFFGLSSVALASTNSEIDGNFTDWQGQPTQHFWGYDVAMTIQRGNVNVYLKSKHRLPSEVKLDAGAGKVATLSLSKAPTKMGTHRLKNRHSQYAGYITNHRHERQIELSIPLASINSSLSPSAMIKLSLGDKQPTITSVGLSTYPKLLVGLIVLLWLYSLTIFKRAHLAAFYFLGGSLGVFLLISLFANHYLVQLMTTSLTAVIKVVTASVPGITTDWANNLIQLFTIHGERVQAFINYECSGVIETVAFISLLAFFPLYTKLARLGIALGGILWIFLANLIRLLFILLTVKYIGANTLFVTHALIGRILFYTMVIILYYNVFTRPQILNGWHSRQRLLGRSQWCILLQC